MSKLILDNNFKTLLNLFNQKKHQDFIKRFKDFENRSMVCEKSINLFALYLSQIKNYKESTEYLKRALKLNPDFLQAKINLSTLYLLTNKANEAKKILDDVLKKNPTDKVGLFLLAEIESRLDNLEKSEEIFDKIVNNFPTDFNVYFKVGLFYFNRNFYAKAENFFKKTLQLNFSFGENRYYLAITLKKLKKFDEAINLLKQTIKANKKDLSCHYLLSEIYRGLGNFDKSNEILKKILENINSNDSIALSHLLLSLQSDQEKENLATKIEKDYKILDEIYKERMGYALFGYYDSKKNYLKASEYLKASLKITKEKNQYSFKTDQAQFDFLKKAFNNQFFKNNLTNKAIDHNKKINIFIVGLHRSGSTLLEQILSTNKNFTSFGELPYFADIVTKFFPDQDLDSFNKNLHNTSRNKFLEIGNEYNIKIGLQNKFSLDKMLSNFRMLGLISVSIPNSFFIHIQRSRNDNLFSILSNFYENNSAPWSYDEESLSKYYDSYSNLMQHWRDNLNNRIVDIKYENLIDNSKEEISKVLKFLNLEWEDKYLNYTENQNMVETASVYQVRKGLYSSSINKWKSYQNYFSALFR